MSILSAPNATTAKVRSAGSARDLEVLSGFPEQTWSGRTFEKTFPDKNSVTLQLPYWLRAAVCSVAIGCLAYQVRNSSVDDALIYARYIQNALQGKGLVFNAGEHINGLTSALDTWLQLGMSYLLGGHVLLAQFVLSIGFFVAAASMAEYLVPFAGLALAVNPLFYFTIGLETSVFVVCLFAVVWAYEKRKLEWLPLLCLLCMLARFEGGALVLFVAIRIWQRKQWPSWRAFIIPAIIIAFYLAFNYHWFHHLVPSSATAKLGQGRSGLWGTWPHAFLQVPSWVTGPFGTKISYFLFLTVLAIYGAMRPGWKRVNEILGPFLVVLALFYIGFNIPNYQWYYAPFVFFLTIYACRLIPHTRGAAVAFFIAFLILGHETARQIPELGLYTAGYRAAGSWIAANTPPNAKIASVEIGAIGWTCERYLIDIVGLTTPKNAVYVTHRDVTSWFEDRPDFVVVHPDKPFAWEKVALNSPEYELLPQRFGEDGAVRILRKR